MSPRGHPEPRTVVSLPSHDARLNLYVQTESNAPDFVNGLITAAIAGHGVAMGRTPLVSDDLAAGRLVKLFDISLPSSWVHYLVYPANHARKPMIVAFRDWLLEEARMHPEDADPGAVPITLNAELNYELN